jgi:hypothetical protein
MTQVRACQRRAHALLKDDADSLLVTVRQNISECKHSDPLSPAKPTYRHTSELALLVYLVPRGN